MKDLRKIKSKRVKYMQKGEYKEEGVRGKSLPMYHKSEKISLSEGG